MLTSGAMRTVTDRHPLLASIPALPGSSPPESLLEELRDLAHQLDHCTARSRLLHEQLRKMLGQERLTACLLGIQFLAADGDAAGARLLAAMLDANTPGAVLLPRVRRFRSTGRLVAADPERIGTEFLAEWGERLTELIAACEARLGTEDQPADSPPPSPCERPPLPLLRRALTSLTPQSTAVAAAPSVVDLRLLAGLIRLECDAYQERVSRLAGTIDPFRVTAVMRALPLLNRADAEVRDLDLLATWLENGEFAPAFARQVPTAWDILEEGERSRFTAALRRDPELAPLAATHAAFLTAPLSVRQLAGPTARMLMLGKALVRAGLRESPLTLLEAVGLVLTHCRDGNLRLALDAALQEAIGCILLSARQGGLEDLAGLDIRDGVLVLEKPRLALGDRIWRHDLPTMLELQGLPASATDPAGAQDAAGADAAEAEAPVDTSATAVKQMVMNNIGSVSILLGFLRNPKVTAIPGLVAEVARRTRSGRVLEVIMADRALVSGVANKDVPRALLESPVNVSVRSLRRFIHVKYVSKTDLRRLARDKARLRKEVCDEIEKYLDSLT
jgi:hypothetical protein